MKILPYCSISRVGVGFKLAAVSLCVRRGRRLAVPLRRVVSGTNDYRDALSELVARAQAAGAHCVMSLPVEHYRIQWVSLGRIGLRSIRAAVKHSTFWQTHLGVSIDSHYVWWQFIHAEASGAAVLLAAAPRERVDFYVGVMRSAGLIVDEIGASCFDYFDKDQAYDTVRAALVLDCGNAYVIARGHFGLRTHMVPFDHHHAAMLLDGDRSVCGEVADGLAAAVRRCVEDEQAVSQVAVRVIAAQAGEWLEVLQSRLSKAYAMTHSNGWDMAGLDVSSATDAWQLPVAAAGLFRPDKAPGAQRFYLRLPHTTKVNFLAQHKRQVSRQRIFTAVPIGVCVLAVIAAYAHWVLLADQQRLQPAVKRYAELSEFRRHVTQEIEELQSQLQHQVAFYSGIQRVSFERKLMPRLLALIEYAALEGVWLNTIQFKQPGSLRIVGRSINDERIVDFIRRLYVMDEIDEAILEKTATQQDVDTRQSLKNFTVLCRLRRIDGDMTWVVRE